MSVHITVQLATKQHTHSCKGELGKGAAGGDGDSGVSEGSGGDAVVVGKAVVGVQVIRQCAYVSYHLCARLCGCPMCAEGWRSIGMWWVCHRKENERRDASHAARCRPDGMNT